MQNKKDKGFTLVELLIVIVILGILATVTVFAVRGITENAQDNSCDVEQRALDTAMEAYYVENDQTYPAAIANLVPTFVKEAPEAGVWDYVAGSGVVTPAAGGRCA